MNDTLFHQIFDAFDDPVLFQTGGGWQFNPAAGDLALSPGDLDRLTQGGDDASLWLAQQFYRVSVSRPEGGVLVLLRPDHFLASAAENVSSQLRTRLNSAFGSVSALGTNASLRSDLRAREDLSAINRELYQILRMVMQLERCGGEDAGPTRMDPIDLAQRFLQLAAEAEELCAQAGVKLTAETDQTSLPMLADGRQLEYLILNLISNALKSVSKEGDGRISLSLKCQQNQAVITVADNAGGFAPDLLVHPLWNEPRRLLPGRGLGLGLPLVQRIAAAHEGTLMVFPSPTGSRVVLSLPIHMPEDLFAQPDLPLDDTPGFSLAKILLSDALPRSAYFPNPYEDNE